MDQEIARRRVSRILDHVAGIDGIASSVPHLFPMNCSSTLNSLVRRRDNTQLFARQGSASQARFMRQVSVTQNLPLSHTHCGTGDSSYQYSGETMFARQAQMSPVLSSSRDGQVIKHEPAPSSTEAPKFAKPNSVNSEKKQLYCNRTRQASICDGTEWSPRIDVVESSSHYVVMVELPGVSIMDIRVEIDDQNLTVAGKRSAQQWRVADGSENLNLRFHRREILQGPYRVLWPLPNDVNKDGVSAEFVNGFLKITLRKS